MSKDKGLFGGLKDTFDNLTDKDRLKKTAGTGGFLLAIRQGKTDVVRQFLKDGQDPNFSTVMGDMPLHIAVRCGHEKIVSLLLRYKADVNARRLTAGRETPLDIAIQQGRTEIIELLGRNHAKVNEYGENGWAPVHMAVQMGRGDVLRALLRAGADGRLPTQNSADAGVTSGQTALEMALMRRRADIVRVLLEDPEIAMDIYKPISQSSSRALPINFAMEFRDREMVETLFEMGVNPVQQDDRGWTPLFHAVAQGDLEMVELCLKYAGGAVPKCLSKAGAHALHVASSLNQMRDKVAVMHRLIDEGLGLNDQTIDGYTPLYFAVRSWDSAAVQVLLDRGARPDMYGIDGKTPLIHAVEAGYYDIAETLLQQGADLGLKNRKTGQTIYEVAQELNDVRMMAVLGRYKPSAPSVIKRPPTP